MGKTREIRHNTLLHDTFSMQNIRINCLKFVLPEKMAKSLTPIWLLVLAALFQFFWQLILLAQKGVVLFFCPPIAKRCFKPDKYHTWEAVELTNGREVTWKQPWIFFSRKTTKVRKNIWLFFFPGTASARRKFVPVKIVRIAYAGWIWHFARVRARSLYLRGSWVCLFSKIVWLHCFTLGASRGSLETSLFRDIIARFVRFFCSLFRRLGLS